VVVVVVYGSVHYSSNGRDFFLLSFCFFVSFFLVVCWRAFPFSSSSFFFSLSLSLPRARVLGNSLSLCPFYSDNLNLLALIR